MQTIARTAAVAAMALCAAAAFAPHSPNMEAMNWGVFLAILALVADELQKLARLRADGTLTEQEFQTLKARLLAK